MKTPRRKAQVILRRNRKFPPHDRRSPSPQVDAKQFSSLEFAGLRAISCSPRPISVRILIRRGKRVRTVNTASMQVAMYAGRGNGKSMWLI